MTGCRAARPTRDYPQRGILRDAAVDDEGAPRREPAARWWVNQGRHLAPNAVARPSATRVRLGNGREKSFRVRVNGTLHDLLDRPDLHNPSEVHHRNPVRDISDRGDIEIGRASCRERV